MSIRIVASVQWQSSYDGELPKSLCEYSRFFIERMFSETLQRPVHTKLLRSWLRDGKSCL